jgi:hypothetical protein
MGMDKKFQLFHLYNKKVLSHGGFRLYRLFLDLEAVQSQPSPVKATRGLLGGFTGLSENSLKAAITELLDLGLVILKSDRPTLWQVNTPDKFNHAALAKLLIQISESTDSEPDSAQSDAK